MCQTGTRQSPIDLDPEKTIPGGFEPLVLLNYDRKVLANITNNGHTGEFGYRFVIKINNLAKKCVWGNWYLKFTEEGTNEGRGRGVTEYLEEMGLRTRRKNFRMEKNGYKLLGRRETEREKEIFVLKSSIFFFFVLGDSACFNLILSHSIFF